MPSLDFVNLARNCMNRAIVADDGRILKVCQRIEVSSISISWSFNEFNENLLNHDRIYQNFSECTLKKHILIMLSLIAVAEGKYEEYEALG
jgi:hypothetical protein